MTINTAIQPFGSNAEQERRDAGYDEIQPIKLFGCTVVDFNVSADWSAQGGSLSCRLIEDESAGDRLQMPVLGSPALFEMVGREYDGNYYYDKTVFQYIGIVDSFSRSASNSKTYSVNLSSPLRILDSATVILDGYLGMGSAIEGMSDFSGTGYQDYGSNNSLIDVLSTVPGVYHWWNVSNLINVYGILENDDVKYRFPTAWYSDGTPSQFGGYGYSGRSQNGIPLVKLMWALHHGINHVPYMVDEYRQRTAGGNLLYGRHNYQMDLAVSPVFGIQYLESAVPYYYHFDALDFYNQIYPILGPEFRVEGEYKTLKDLIGSICDEANVDWYSYIDIYKEPLSSRDSYIGRQTLQEIDPNWGRPARCSFVNMGSAQPANAGFDTRKFYEKLPNGDPGNYGGTIRIQTISKTTYVNYNRPFSNIAYNLIGLEVPDIKKDLFKYYDGLRYNSGIHPGRRPSDSENWEWGVATQEMFGVRADPLDASGLDQANEGWRNVGTKTISDGGSAFWNTDTNWITRGTVNATGFPSSTSFPVFGSGIFDPTLSAYPRPKNSDISLKINDAVTMKVVTGGKQTRIVTAPGRTLRHYWGDIILPNASNPRETNNVETDPLGLNEQSTKKIPVVTPLLDPRDVDDYILIDMKSLFGLFDCPGVLRHGVYAASMLEIRCAMKSLESWKAFMDKYKYQKIRNLRNCFYPNCGGGSGSTKKNYEQASETINVCGGLGYVGTSHHFGLGNTFSLSPTPTDGFSVTLTASGAAQNPPHIGTAGGGVGPFGLGFDIPCAVAEINIRKHLLPAIHEKVKAIGDTHYGKSWYAPVPYCQSIEDLDGENLVGNFKRSWEMTSSAYVEPSLYYLREIPQDNNFISDGKVSPFINYDHNFVLTAKEDNVFDKSYADMVNSLVGQKTQVFNFSEYDMKSLCQTKYSANAQGLYTYPLTVIHAPPESVSDTYEFLPFMYERIYNRALLPYSEMIKGRTLKWNNYKTANPMVGSAGKASAASSASPISAGHVGTSEQKDYLNDEDVLPVPDNDPIEKTIDDNKFLLSSPIPADCPGANPLQMGNSQGYFSYGIINGVPAYTQPDWLNKIVPTLEQLDFNDNGRFCFPFVKFTSNRVFLPVPSPASPYTVNRTPSMDGFNAFVGAQLKRNLGFGCVGSDVVPTFRRQHLITEDEIISVLMPFQACVCPRSFNYAQVSTRYVYGPWMTSFSGIAFRGKVEYEQDDSLVPENFLIPTNLGPFGEYQLKQTSGFAGMNLAAQGRANAIDNFLLFALEEGKITFPGAPEIKRIGDAFYGIQHISDINISVSNDNIETSYSFKTIAPKFGKNNRELEKRLTKISNEIKKLKMR